VAVTFSPHPAKVLRPERAPRLLTAHAHKIQLIQALGVEHVLTIPFTPEFAVTPPEEFVLALHAACKPLRQICVGHQWCFGRNRAGNLQMLGRWGAGLAFARWACRRCRSTGCRFPRR